MSALAIYTFGFALGFISGAVFMALIRLGKTVDNRPHKRVNRNRCPWPMAGSSTRIGADNNTGRASFKHKFPSRSIAGSEASI